MMSRFFIAALLSLVNLAAIAGEPDFCIHTIEKNSPLVQDAVMSCVLADLDGDGDLDWTAGTIWPKPRKERTLYWYEYRGPDEWVRHKIGQDEEMYGGVCTLDANGDGRLDIVATNLWINDQNNKRWSFARTGVGDGAHDMQAVDMNGDKQLDLLAFTQAGGLNWFEKPDNLKHKWTRHKIASPDYAGEKVHATGSPQAANDLDGDGDIDIAAVHGWFENANGDGLKWKYHRHRLFPAVQRERFPWGFAVKTATRDIDGDGDIDIVQTECDTPEIAGVAWLENSDGKGDFTLHWIKERSPEDFHSLCLLDYDGDGDWDVLSGTGPLATADEKRLYLFENVVAESREIQWKQHVIHTGMPIHEARAGDVDGDGDADIVIKPWNKKDEPKDFLFLENRLVP